MSRPVRGGASYRAVLALPHARGLFFAAMLARLCYAVLGLPLFLSLRQATGSYASAGTAVGVFGLLSALLGPARARLVERRPRTLTVLAVVYAALLGAIAAIGWTGASPGSAIAVAALAGLFPPPVGPLMRALWGVLATDPGQRQRALSLDTVSESAVFATGPALGGALIGAASAPAALIGCAGLVLVGFTVLAVALRRLPERPSTVDSPTESPTDSTAGPAARSGLLRRPGLAAMLLVVSGSACALTVAELAAIARWGAGPTGALLTLCSLGGVAGGLAYGRRTWRSSPGRRLRALGAAGAACFALSALLPLLPVAVAAFLGIGICGDTVMITAYLVVDDTVPEGSRMEAGAWVNTAYNLGASLGSALAGTLLDRTGSGAVLATAAAVAGLAVCAATAGGRPATARPPIRPGEVSGVQYGDLPDAEVLERAGN